jgi:hypothetical protein
MLRKGARIVMTTRDYVYRRARKDLKESAFPLLRESQVVIDVHDLSKEERRQILYNHIKLGRQPRDFRTRIKPQLNGSFVYYVQSEAIWRFRHPTVGDAIAALLLESPELLGIYVRGSSIDQLMDQITCGDVGLERAVVLPKALFPLVLERLGEFSTIETTKYKTPIYSSWYRHDRLERFLATRCSKEFLAEYINADPEILDRASLPGLSLSAVSSVDLAIRLNEFGLFPEERRKTFVQTVIAYAMDGQDLYAIESARIQSMFTSRELGDFRARLRIGLLPKLFDIRYDWESYYDSGNSADGHMQPLIDSFSALKTEFADEPEIVSEIGKQIQLAEEWIAEHSSDDSISDRQNLTLGQETSEFHASIIRGIFDDIDA